MKILEYRNGDVIVEYNNEIYVRLNYTSQLGLYWKSYEHYINNNPGFILSGYLEPEFKIAIRKMKLDSL